MTLPFTLGTAQFGMPYGITNTIGQLPEKEINVILNEATHAGIKSLDTSFAYGSSIERLQSFIKAQPSSHFYVVNKFSVLEDWEVVYQKLKTFLNQSGLNQFYGILIHDPHNLSQINITKLQTFLDKLKSQNITEKVGVSVYTFSELTSLTKLLSIDLIQAPINLLNQSFLTTQAQEFIQQHAIEVHARSLFLQGVLLANQLPTILEPLQPHWDAYQAMLKQQNLSPLQATLSWIKHNPRVSKWVIGVTTPNELQQIIHTYQNEIKHSQHDFPYEKLDCSHHPFIDPRQWPKL